MSFLSSLRAAPRLGLGLAALGRPGYINLGHALDLKQNYAQSAMEQHAHQVLERAWELGIRYFDTARSYGLGEQFLGNWVQAKGLNPAAVLIGSKWGYTYTADWQVEAEKHEVKDHRLPVLNRQWEETQSTLGSYLDLYQIHSATLESGVLTRPEVLDRLASLKAQGTAIGLSLSGAHQAETLAKALEVSVDGIGLFDSVQATYNLLELSAASFLAAAHEAGWGVIIKEGLANGRLTSRNSAPEFAQQKQVLTQLAADEGTTIDALALAFILAQPWVDMVLSGVAQVDHLESNFQALSISWQDSWTSSLAQIAESPATYWRIRKGLAWN